MGEAVAWWKIVPYSAFCNHHLHMNLTDFFLKGQKLEGAKWQIKLSEFSFPILEERMRSPLGQARPLCASPGDLSVPCRAETNISMFIGLAMASSNCRSSLLLLSFPQTIYWTATSELVIPSGTRWNQGAKSPGRREWSWSLSWRICILTCEKPSEAWEVSACHPRQPSGADVRQLRARMPLRFLVQPLDKELQIARERTQEMLLG